MMLASFLPQTHGFASLARELKKQNFGVYVHCAQNKFEPVALSHIHRVWGMDGQFPYELKGFGVMDGQFPYEYIVFGAFST